MTMPERPRINGRAPWKIKQNKTPDELKRQVTATS